MPSCFTDRITPERFSSLILDTSFGGHGSSWIELVSEVSVWLSSELSASFDACCSTVALFCFTLISSFDAVVLLLSFFFRGLPLRTGAKISQYFQSGVLNYTTLKLTKWSN